MSFPKAKIHRFNEDVSCAPPPGTYDPKLAPNMKGTPNQKVKRKFPDQQCISTSLDSLNKCNNTRLTFRTPQVVRKIGLTPRLRSTHDKNIESKVSLSSTRSTKDGNVFKTPIPSANYQPLEQQRNNLVDSYVSEITTLKSDNFKLQETLNQVKQREEGIKLILKEKIALVLKIQHELFEVKHNFDNIEEIIEKERGEYAKYTEELNSEILLLRNKEEDLKSIIAEKQIEIRTLTDKYSNLESEFVILQEQNEETFKFIEGENSKCMSTFVLESENKIEHLEQIVKSKVLNLEKEFDSAQESALAQLQTKMDDLINHEYEPKLFELNNHLQSCLTRSKELQSLVDQNEKKYLESFREVDERCRLIYRELCKVEIQRDELLVSDLDKKLTIMDMQKKSESCEEDLKLNREKCKKYEIALRTMHETVNALSNRLLESENEVMRLSSLSFIFDCQKQSFNEKFLISDIKAVREGIKERSETNEDYFKMELAKKVQILNDEIHYKQSTIDKLQKELDNVSDLVNEHKSLHLSNENKISDYQIKMEDYHTDLGNAEREVRILKKENAEQLDKITVLKDKIKSIEEVMEKKSKTEVKLQQCIDGLFSDLVLEKKRYESLEVEKNRVELDLALIETSYRNKEQEIEELNLKIDTMDRSLKNLEERVTLTEEDKGVLEMQLLNAENNALAFKLENEHLSNSNEELKNKVSELQQLLYITKEQVKNEIPNLQRDIINKAACILELSLNIDTLTDTISKYEENISYFQAENSNLIMQLSEAKSQVSNCIGSSLSDYVADTLKAHREVLKVHSDNDMKLQVAEEKICVFEEELSTSNIEHESGLSEAYQAPEDLESQLKIITEERNKLKHELAYLMKHQNIEDVNKLKQTHAELREKADYLERENSRLNKTLAMSKENVNILQLENSPKAVKIKIKTTQSPAVLKDRNC